MSADLYALGLLTGFLMALIAVMVGVVIADYWRRRSPTGAPR